MVYDTADTHPTARPGITRLNRGVALRWRDDGGLEIYFRYARKGYIVRWRDTTDMEAAIAALYTGAPTADLPAIIAERCDVLRNEAEELLHRLTELGALVTTPDSAAYDVDHHQYDRQIMFMNDFETQDDLGIRLCERLQNRRVVVVGLGALGSWILLQCARMGIRQLVGVDSDDVELSNLHRTILYDRDDVGHPKAERWTRLLRGVDDRIEFESHNLRVRSVEDLLPIIEGADLVFNEFGYLPPVLDVDHAGQLIPQAGLIANVPVMSQTGSWIGPLTVPGAGPCLRCVQRQMPIDRSVAISSSFASLNGENGGFAPRVALWAGASVWEAARYLAGMEPAPPATRGVVILDTFSYGNQQVVEIPRDPGCEWCGSLSHLSRSPDPMYALRP